MPLSRHRVSLLVVCGLLSGPAAIRAADGNAVTEWAALIQTAVQNASSPPARPPASSEVLHAMIHLAVYNAVVAIEGGSAPFPTGGAPLAPAPGADVRAAVATAAYLTARYQELAGSPWPDSARIAPSQYAYLDGTYAAYMAALPTGGATLAGIEVGTAAAAAILEHRKADGFSATVLYACSATPPDRLPIGEFEPNDGCDRPDRQPVDVKLAQVTPYTFADPRSFRPDGPEPMTSRSYYDDFEETRTYGAAANSLRTEEQTDVVRFWADNTYAQWNRNLIGLAIARGLDTRATARLFAMAHTASADALIAGFEAKYHYRAWRPRTAIPLADEDPNPDTAADPTWEPLLSVNHPEYPSAHGFWSRALVDTLAAFFGTHRFEWSVDSRTPMLLHSRRTYSDLNALMREIDDARVWGGLHWRHSIRHGGKMGRAVARHVVRTYFQPVP